MLSLLSWNELVLHNDVDIINRPCMKKTRPFKGLCLIKVEIKMMIAVT